MTKIRNIFKNIEIKKKQYVFFTKILIIFHFKTINLYNMAHSDENLNKIADFLAEQESAHRESNSNKIEINQSQQQAIDKIHKFLENQSLNEENKECNSKYLLLLIP